MSFKQFALFLLMVVADWLYAMELSTDVALNNKEIFDAVFLKEKFNTLNSHPCFSKIRSLPRFFNFYNIKNIFTIENTEITFTSDIPFFETVTFIQETEDVISGLEKTGDISGAIAEFTVLYDTYEDFLNKNDFDILMPYWQIFDILAYWESIKKSNNLLLDYNGFFNDFRINKLFTLSDFQKLERSFPYFNSNNSNYKLARENSFLISHIIPWLQVHGPRLVEWHRLNREGSPLLYEVWNAHPYFAKKRYNNQRTELIPTLFASDVCEFRGLYGSSKGSLDFDKKDDKEHIKAFFETLAANIEKNETILNRFLSLYDKKVAPCLDSSGWHVETPLRGSSPKMRKGKYWGAWFNKKLLNAYRLCLQIEVFFGLERSGVYFLFQGPPMHDFVKKIENIEKEFEPALPIIKNVNDALKKHFLFSLDEKCCFFDPILIEMIKKELSVAKDHKRLKTEAEANLVHKCSRVRENYKDLLSLLSMPEVATLMDYQKDFLQQLTDQNSYIRKSWPQLCTFLNELLPSIQKPFEQVDNYKYKYFLEIRSFLLYQHRLYLKDDIYYFNEQLDWWHFRLKSFPFLLVDILFRIKPSVSELVSKFERLFGQLQKSEEFKTMPVVNDIIIYDALLNCFIYLYPEFFVIQNFLEEWCRERRSSNDFGCINDPTLAGIFRSLENLKKKVTSSDTAFFQKKYDDLINAVEILKKLDRNVFSDPIDIVTELERNSLFFSIDQNDPAILNLKTAAETKSKEVFIVEHIIPLIQQFYMFYSYNRKLGWLFQRMLNKPIMDEKLDPSFIIQNTTESLPEQDFEALKKQVEFYNAVFGLQKPCVFRLSDNLQVFDKELINLFVYYQTLQQKFIEIKAINRVKAAMSFAKVRKEATAESINNTNNDNEFRTFAEGSLILTKLGKVLLDCTQKDKRDKVFVYGMCFFLLIVALKNQNYFKHLIYLS
ncbi:hypothetical protein IPG37_01335 [bacterium]|nr:MAG: hypothetical protein IPG37_01335 [bacterium]QQR62756.1 MAG: hypothetical protein IPH67_05100 [bacterium]